MKKFLLSLVMVGVVLLLCAGVWAQEIDDSLFAGEADFFQAEEQIVVSASKREQKLSEAPVAISVITREDIKRLGCRSIPDALRMVPGVYVQRPTRGDTQVAIRGLVNGPPETGPYLGVSRNILVLLNGRSFFNDVYGGVIWANLPITLEDIERIEVVRGPSSPLFGANAVTGVINIITRDPEAAQGFKAKATVSGESENRKMNFMVEDKYDDLAWRLTSEREIIEYQEYTEFDVTKQKWVQGRGDRLVSNYPGTAGMYDNNTSRLNLSMLYRFNDRNSLDFEAGRTNGAVSMMGSNGDFLKVYHHIDNLFLKGAYNTHIGNAPSKLTLSWIDGRIGIVVPYVDSAWTVGNASGALSWSSYDVEAQSIIDLSDHDILVAGLNWRKTYAKSGNLYFFDFPAAGEERNDPTYSQEFIGLFLNNEYRISDQWKFVAAARYDDFDVPDDSAISPQAILVYSPDRRATYRLSYSEAIRTAFIVDLFLSGNGDFFSAQLGPALAPAPNVRPIGYGMFFFGNPDLDFPRIKNIELGGSFQLSKRHSLDVNLFSYTLTDSIVFDNRIPAGGNDPFSPFFIGDTQTTFNLTFKNDNNDIESIGAELGAKIQLTKKIMAWGNVTYQRSKYGGERSKATPELIANVGVSTDIKGWRLDLSANYVSETEVAATNVLDRNFDQITQGAPGYGEDLCPGDPAGPCRLDSDPATNAAIQTAAAMNFWCDIHDYNADFLGAAYCPELPVGHNNPYNPANMGWWSLMTFGTILEGVPMSTAVMPSYPDDPLTFQADLGNFYATYIGGGDSPSPQINAVFSGFAGAMIANQRIYATSIAISNETTDSYFMFNLRIAKDVVKDQAEFYLSVENLFDDKHREFAYGEILGRRFEGGVNVNF